MRLSKRSLIAGLHDYIIAIISLPLALYMRLGDDFWQLSPQIILIDSAIFNICFILFALLMRLQNAVWRYVSVNELSTIIKVCVLSIIAAYISIFFYNRLDGVPRSVPFLQLMLLIAGLSSTRLLYRKIKETNKKSNTPRINVLLVGANDHSDDFIKMIAKRRDSEYQVVGIIDDNKARMGRNMSGIPIFAPLSQLEDLLKKLDNDGKKPQRLILTEQYIDNKIIEPFLEICATQGIAMARLPRLTDLKDGSEKQDIRPVAIEDLLNRPQTEHDINSMAKLIRGRAILVTGAGGSIGSELVRQIAANQPAKLMIVEQSEHNLYQIDKELNNYYPNLIKQAIIADVRDSKRIRQIIAENNPEIIFHAAAIKHVPIAENNPEETIITNVFGTRNVALAAAMEGVETFVLVSTDKAVHPANVMGASKRLAEMVCANIAMIAPELKMVIVRFGNVLGSTGSVVPLFQEQLKAGGPLTVTHPDMERYFMTIREASGLVIQAASQANKGVGLYILDMGKPVRIINLAEQIIRLSGFTPNKDVQIRFTGLRAGEKLREELVYGKEPLGGTQHPKIMRTKLHTSQLPSEQSLEALELACKQFNSDMVIRLLQDLVPEYSATVA
jgi:FlaA1/EpsC-like NDP-sugar epimerase